MLIRINTCWSYCVTCTVNGCKHVATFKDIYRPYWSCILYQHNIEHKVVERKEISVRVARDKTQINKEHSMKVFH